MKRQRGRNRGGNTGGGGGGKPQQNINRAFDSNGPDGVKIRGNAQHVFEKYQQLARDAASGGDRVLAEGYLQHAEHYFRVLRAFQPQRPPSDFLGRDSFGSGLDIDFEDDGANSFTDGEVGGEGEGQTSAEGESFESRGEQQGRDQNRNDQNRNDQNRGEQRDWGRERREQRQRDEQRPRDDRPRDEQRPRDDRPRDEQRPREDRARDDRPRDDRPRDDRPRDRFRNENRYDRADRPREERDPLAVVEPEAAAPLGDSGHQLRSQDGGLSPAPAFLQARADRPPEAIAEESEPRRTRRRRAPRSFEGDAGPAPAETEEV
ncbi:MAG TPA: DUF4167 domain-containing protein [Caulobacteraceae bacterium]|nr:DUF4167 domain-containing protein [Caulobacteraceae bacterium]